MMALLPFVGIRVHFIRSDSLVSRVILNELDSPDFVDFQVKVN